MTDLYSDGDLLRINTQLKRRYLALGAAAALLLALFAVSLSLRLEWLSVVALFLLCACGIFCVELFILPLIRYRRLLTSARSGRSHVGDFEFSAAEEETSLVDGVPCRALIFLGEPDKHGSREQRFYWDEQHPLPGFQPGETVSLKYSGKNIIAWERR